MLHVERVRLIIARAQASQMCGHSLGCRDKKVTAAAGRIADFEVKQFLLGLGWIGNVDRFVDDGIESRIE